MISRAIGWGVAALALGLMTPHGAYAQNAQLVAAAEAEGKLTIYANTEQFAMNAILQDFAAAYPNIKVDYLELKAADLYGRVSAEGAAGALQADFIWSSAMDLQFKLVDEGLAATYASAEKPHLPDWSVWKDQIYGITFEPVVMVYNKQRMPAADIPKTRADLAKLLQTKSKEYEGKVATYDPERSGLGYFVISHDVRNGNAIWDVAKGFGACKAKLYTATGTMLEKVGAGEHWLAYNVIGPYALLKAQKDPNIGIVIPEDYTIVLSRSALIPKAAPHPNAARLFLDYLLSARGQNVIANKSLLYSIRDDVEGEATARKLKREHGASLRPVAMGTDLLNEIEPTSRLPFFKKWQAALKGQ